MTSTVESLNAEILYWMSETDKRKVQLGEYLLDDPCEPEYSLWQRHADSEVAEMRKTVSDENAMAIIIELIRDKHALKVRQLCGFIFNL